MSEGVTHLAIDAGPDQGRKVCIPPEGARVGRSSKNTVVLLDPKLSRYHCRLFFKPGEGLWVTDLGSANQTLVNDTPIQEACVRVGDRITIGDTVMRVVGDQPAATPAEAPAAANMSPVVDLGLNRRAAPGPRRRFGVGPLIVMGVLSASAAVVIWWPQLHAPHPPRPIPQPEPLTDARLTIEYEKVEATAENVFRYHLLLARNGLLSVSIDDIRNDRHVRKEKQVDPDYLKRLADSLFTSGLFGLQDEYVGIQPDVLDLRDLSVSVGRKTHRTKVVNRVEPDVFRNAVEIVEAFGKNELGLWAMQFSSEKLTEMARDALALSRKLYDEREVKYANLAAAIQHLNEADWYLETVEPKPDFYPDIVAALTDCRKFLQEQFDDHNFRAERAIRLQDWRTAGDELRVLCELVPDAADPRHKDARRKLLDVEKRVKSSK